MISVEKFTAGVRYGTTAFSEEEGVFRNGEIDAAARLLPGNAIVVTLGVIPEERKHEAILAARRSMAGSSVAATGSENGNDVLLKADFSTSCSSFYDERNVHLLASKFDGDS